MATKNPTKKTAEPKQQSAADLRVALATKQNDLLDYRRSLAAGELKNTRIIGTTRKEIARLMTALNAAEQTGKGEK
jgi:ribosomal protein L29